MGHVLASFDSRRNEIELQELNRLVLCLNKTLKEQKEKVAQSQQEQAACRGRLSDSIGKCETLVSFIRGSQSFLLPISSRQHQLRVLGPGSSLKRLPNTLRWHAYFLVAGRCRDLQAYIISH